MDEKGHTNFLPTFGTLELCLAPACNARIGTRQLDDRLCPVVDTSDDAKLVSISITITNGKLTGHWPDVSIMF